MTTMIQVADAEAVARSAADEIDRSAYRALETRGRFLLALAGGATPRRLYELLADADAPYRSRLPWEAMHVFFGDERHVPPDHPDSNYGMAHEALLRHVHAASVHRIQAEVPDAAVAAATYEADLEHFFGLAVGDDPPPALDVVLLGLGRDGHTASLFPGSPALDESRRWVAAPFIESLRAHRITLTLPVLNRARQVLFLVSGPDKADAIARVFRGEQEPVAPAARVRPAGSLTWIVDRAAAANLPPEVSASAGSP